MQSRKNQNLWSGKSNPKTTFVFSLPELRSIAMNIIFSQSPSISYLNNISSSFSIPRFSMINFKLKYPHIPPRSQTSLPFFFFFNSKNRSRRIKANAKRIEFNSSSLPSSCGSRSVSKKKSLVIAENESPEFFLKSTTEIARSPR